MEVFFNGEPAKLVGGNRTMLQVIIPVVPFPEAKASIKLGMADYQVIGKEEICIKDKWLMVSNDAPDNFVNYTGSFVIGSKAYFLLLKDAPEQNELMVFETKTLNWESKQLEVPLLATSNVTGSSEKGYLYTQSENNNFWEYDPNIDLWTKRKKFPGKNRDFSVMFSVGKYIFLGLGNDQNTPWEPNFSDFYRYDPIQDDWEEMEDLDFGPSSPKLKMACTVVGDKIILSGGGSFGVWMYDSTKNSWDRKNDFPMALSFTSGFSFNDQGFVTLGRQVWKYNFQDDSWTEVDEVGFSYRYRSFAFTIEGKAYIGGGDAIPPTIWGNPTRNVYRYDRPSF
ncbi:Kelch repeat-containing protein [Aquiflexum gelatinilyticum]|uniref:Galactose oxidase n=1 Tax=Aquiflexum gelatinilyticum TaxID=2961943 RepID=A0A9X2T1Z3_9BACT|nr:hypothetical protein [Aquiflexum gelatinilyticum]MCR9016296.1 hypothetical protein [Aquiflexum gelatinilyticum]